VNTRERGLSFEFFSFENQNRSFEQGALSSSQNSQGSNRDSGTVTGSGGNVTGGRKRGDSIIFDSKSFEDGGVAEGLGLQIIQNAIVPPSVPSSMNVKVYASSASEAGEEGGNSINPQLSTTISTVAATLQVRTMERWKRGANDGSEERGEES